MKSKEGNATDVHGGASALAALTVAVLVSCALPTVAAACSRSDASIPYRTQLNAFLIAAVVRRCRPVDVSSAGLNSSNRDRPPSNVACPCRPPHALAQPGPGGPLLESRPSVTDQLACDLIVNCRYYIRHESLERGSVGQVPAWKTNG